MIPFDLTSLERGSDLVQVIQEGREGKRLWEYFRRSNEAVTNWAAKKILDFFHVDFDAQIHDIKRNIANAQAAATAIRRVTQASENREYKFLDHLVRRRHEAVMIHGVHPNHHNWLQNREEFKEVRNRAKYELLREPDKAKVLQKLLRMKRDERIQRRQHKRRRVG